MSELTTTFIDSPIGFIQIVGNDGGVQEINFCEEKGRGDIAASAPVRSCAKQLEEFFSNEREVFTFPISPKGTDFQVNTWEAISKVKYGETVSYGNLAAKMGDARAVRAVASANGANPLPIIIPCHRVVGEKGDLTGYSGGIWRKKWLLAHEQPAKQIELFK